MYRVGDRFSLVSVERVCKTVKWQKGLLLSLSCIAFALGIYLLQNNIPDEVNLAAGEEWNLELNYPLNGFVREEVTAVGSQGQSNIPSGEVKVTCKLLGMIPIKEIQVNRVTKQQVIPGGNPVGIYMKTNGILVVGTGTVGGIDGLDYEPAVNIVQSGDYITGINDVSIASKEELVEKINQTGGEAVRLQIIRGGEASELQLAPVKTGTEEYKLGIWVRDDTQGIGTLTYIDGENRFGALGHGISDVDTGGLLNLKSGTLYHTDILSITKGEKGMPGELSGVIRYQQEEVLGDISSNTEEGIFGSVNQDFRSEIANEPVDIAFKQEIQPGPASIMCAVDGQVDSYEIEIEKVILNGKEANKSMVIRVTDPELLAKTGGIVQGMSGSPILQNGKLIGAVTHVFIQDSTMGYGIFIENMLDK